MQGGPVQTAIPYCGSAICVLGSFLNEWAAVIGVVIAVITYFTNLYFQIRRTIRNNEEHRKIQKLWEDHHNGSGDHHS